MQEIKESDWKVFRELREIALERFCERIISEIAELISDDGKTHHARYLSVYKLIHERDGEMDGAFNGLSRSRAFVQLRAIQELNLLTNEEVARFSPETKERIGPLQGKDRRD